MKEKKPKILKRKNSFVYIDEYGNKMGLMNINTGKFVGATLCRTQLYDHLQEYKKTPEYLELEKSRLEQSIKGSTEKFHTDLAQLEEVENKLNL